MDSAALDPWAILATLGVRDALSVTRVQGGFDTAIWRIERGGSFEALRVFRSSQTASFRRELLAMGAADAGGIPVPQVLATGTWHERPVMCLSWCRGRPLVDELRARPWRLWSLGVQFGRLQAAIHAIAAPPDLAAEDRAWIDLAGPAETALQEFLRRLPPRPPALLHLDYHPLNVLTDGRQLTAVLDWTNALAGDPRADVARTLSILRLAQLPARRSAPRERLFRRLLAQAWWHGYREAAGEPGDLSPFYAWAAAVLIRDLAPRPGRPAGGLPPPHVDRARRWLVSNQRRAGITR